MDKVAKQPVSIEESANLLAEWVSLLSHYQSLCLSHDTEMLNMLELLDQTRNKWRLAQTEGERLASKVASVERENRNLHEEIEAVQERFRKSEEKVASLITTQQSMKAEIVEYKKRFESVRNILKDNAGNVEQMSRLMPLLSDDSTNTSSGEEINGSESESRTPPDLRGREESSIAHNDNAGIDYDRTEDSLGEHQHQPNAVVAEKVELRGGRNYIRRSNQPSGKRRSASQQPPKKRSVAMAQLAHIAEVEALELDDDEENVCPTPPKRSRDEKRVPRVRIDSARRTFRRSASESNVIAEDAAAPPPPPAHRTPRGAGTSRADIRSPMVGFGSTWTKGRAIEECDHKFASSNAFFMASCAVCFKSVGFRAWQCDDCKLYVHENCKPNAPMPCLPVVNVPQKQKQRPRLVDYCPDSQPKIPALLIRCVIALEKRHLNSVGLYRVQGNEREVKALLEAFNSPYGPNLNNRDPETIASCIKKFLIGLREPLIPTSSYNEFIKAAGSDDPEELMSVVMELPIPNRDTLAYLCAHWQKVASNSNVNQMPIENIARCLGPTVVGGFSSIPKNARLADQQVILERQINVLNRLLRLTPDFWKGFYDSPVVTDAVHTPRNQRQILAPRTAPPCANRIRDRGFNADNSILGPVTKSPSKGALLQPIVTRTPARPLFKRPY